MKSTSTSVLKVGANEKGMGAGNVANDIDLGHDDGFSFFFILVSMFRENISVSSC
jgi:hypothetical protein